LNRAQKYLDTITDALRALSRDVTHDALANRPGSQHTTIVAADNKRRRHRLSRVLALSSALQKLRCYTGIMTSNSRALADLSDRELIAHVSQLANNERAATAQLIASLAELDSRRLYLGEGCSSLFTYCTQVLHLSEHAAYGRIEAAPASRRFSALLKQLAEGDLTLTAVCLLAPHLTMENHRDVIALLHSTKWSVPHQRGLAPFRRQSRKMAGGRERSYIRRKVGVVEKSLQTLTRRVVGDLRGCGASEETMVN
jgi:hypothetical protein